jgi:hypothetical protein
MQDLRQHDWQDFCAKVAQRGIRHRTTLLDMLTIVLVVVAGDVKTVLLFRCRRLSQNRIWRAGARGGIWFGLAKSVTT